MHVCIRTDYYIEIDVKIFTSIIWIGDMDIIQKDREGPPVTPQAFMPSQ